MAESARGRTLTVFGVLFVVLAVSNFLKPFQIGGERTGFVFFGQRLSGTPNTIAGPIFGAYLLIYAIGILRMKRWAVPMAWAYAAYVVVNLTLFTVRTVQPPGVGYKLFGLVYSVIAISVSAGAAYLLTQRRAALT